MTESDWNRCTDPQKMLEWLRHSERASERKLRLFTVACCRRIWQHLKEKRSRRLVEVAEAFADGGASLKQLRTAFERAADAQEAVHWEGGDAVEQSAAEAVLGLREDLQFPAVFEGIAEAVGEVRAGEAWARIYQTPGKDYRAQEAEHRAECDAGAAAEQEVQVVLLRDLFGPLPFRAVDIDPAWLAWNDGTVRRLAETVYAERLLPAGPLDGGRLAVLADALEDCGSTNADLLAHLRGPGPHVRGCWAVDLLLAKD
jgi:hypothetical protein